MSHSPLPPRLAQVSKKTGETLCHPQLSFYACNEHHVPPCGLQHLLQPLIRGKEWRKGDLSYLGAGAGSKHCWFWRPLMPFQPPCWAQRRHSTRTTSAGTILLFLRKSVPSTKIIIAARFVGMQSPETPNRPVACQGKWQHPATLQRQREN